MREIVLIQTTLPSRETAIALGRKAIECHIAACVNFHAVESLYTWKGSLCEQAEFHMDLKTSINNLEKLLSFVKKEHPYEIPTLICSTIEVNSDYADWVEASTDQASI